MLARHGVLFLDELTEFGRVQAFPDSDTRHRMVEVFYWHDRGAEGARWSTFGPHQDGKQR
jgi:hypothetical protein